MLQVHHITIKQATALGSNFGTIMDYNASFSDESNGIVAFALPLERIQEHQM